MFLFTFNKFLYCITMSMERATGSNKLLYKEAAPRSEPYQPYRVLLTGKAFLSYESYLYIRQMMKLNQIITGQYLCCLILTEFLKN